MASLKWIGAGAEADPVPGAAERLRSLRLLPPPTSPRAASSIDDGPEDDFALPETPVVGGWVPGRSIEPPTTNESLQTRTSPSPGAAADVRSGVGSSFLWPRLTELVDRFGVVPLLVAAGVLVAAIGLGGGWWLGNRHALPPAAATGALPDLGTSDVVNAPSSGSALAADGSSSATDGADVNSGSIVVDVAGRVRHPGLVTLPLGARVADAIAAAGGLSGHVRDPTLNLAARVGDGQLLDIARLSSAGAAAAGAAGGGGEVGAGGAVSGASGGTTAAGSGAPLDLNTATEAQLDALPGIGPVLAQRIIDYVSQQGGFTSVEQLEQVPGIGPSHYDEVKDLVTA